MELEWDADKAARNLKKHGVSFEDAELVFYDSGRVEAYDGREDYGEDRWATIGQFVLRDADGEGVGQL